MQRILLNNQPADPDEVYMMLKADASDDQILAFDAALKHWRGLLDDSQRDSIKSPFVVLVASTSLKALLVPARRLRLPH